MVKICKKTGLFKAESNDLKWFKLEHYDFISSITIEQLLREFETRLFCYDLYDNEEYAESTIYSVLYSDPYIHRNDNDSSLDDNNSYTPLSKVMPYPDDCSLVPLNLHGLVKLVQLFFDEKILTLNNNKFHYGKRETFTQISKLTQGDDISVFPLIIGCNIKTYSDEEILKSMEKFLPIWRKSLQIKEPEIPKVNIGIQSLKKIISYRALPIIDILLWCRLNWYTISDTLLSFLVFKDEFKDSYVIKDTIKPFAENLFTVEYLRLYKLFVEKNEHLKNITTSVLLDI